MSLFNTSSEAGKNSYNEIPQGLSMALARDMDALDYFCSLTDDEKASVIAYIQASATGEDAKSRIAKTVSNLKEHKTNFTVF